MNGSAEQPANHASRGLALRHTFDAAKHDIRAIAWFPDGRALLAIAGNSTAWLWDIQTGDVRWTVKHAPGGVPSCLAWSPHGRYWLVGTWQRALQLCGAASGAAYETYLGISSSVIGVGWSHDAQGVDAVSQDGEFARWEMFSGRSVK